MLVVFKRQIETFTRKFNSLGAGESELVRTQVGADEKPFDLRRPQTEGVLSSLATSFLQRIDRWQRGQKVQQRTDPGKV